MTWRTERHWECPDCNGIFTGRTLLIAPDPFGPPGNQEVLNGCPTCRHAIQPIPVCDYDQCRYPVTAGWVEDGTHLYRNTCHKHRATA